MSPEIRELLEDILERIAQIKAFTSDLEFPDYQQDAKTKLAVERSLEIIGEALSRIKKEDPIVLEEIQEHRSIISFRNILAHAYDNIEDKIVWGVITSDLDKLEADIRKLT